MIRKSNVVSILFTVLFLTGCASLGGADVSDAAVSGDPVAMAKEGAELNSRGAKMVKDGEALLIKGRKRVRDGEAMVSNGSTLVTNARFGYRDLARTMGDATNPKTVSSEAKKLKNAGKRWEDAIDTIKDGNKLIDKGNDDISDAQKAIRKGRQLMERGSVMVRNSERLRMEESLLSVPGSSLQ